MNWPKSYSFGIDSIDNQHFKLYQILTDIEDDIRTKKISQTLGHHLEKILSFTSYHFEYEETLMKKFDFEGAEDHIEEHDRFTQIIEAFCDQVQIAEEIDPDELYKHIKIWFEDHEIKFDREYLEVFKKNDVK